MPSAASASRGVGACKIGEHIAAASDLRHRRVGALLERNVLTREEQRARAVAVLDRCLPRERRLDGVARPPYVHVRDRKSTRLNSSHVAISYAVFCLKKKNTSH